MGEKEIYRDVLLFHGTRQLTIIWPVEAELRVAVQVTACRGRGHIVAAQLQATQLFTIRRSPDRVDVVCFVARWLRNIPISRCGQSGQEGPTGLCILFV